MKRVALITTGGTIASVKDKTGRATPTLTGKQLLEAVPSIQSVASVSITESSNVPSQYLDFRMMLDLSRKILEIISRERPAGVVITMGTNAMEEDAYFLDLVLETDTPVVITGAMRNRSLPSSDVDINLHDAIVAASSDSLRGQGVVIAMNGELHHARFATKTHTTSVSTFKSPDAGPIGVIRGNSVVLYNRIVSKEHIRPEEINARVDLLRYGMGMDGSLLDAAVGLGAEGAVLEAFGGGHLMPSVVPSIEKAIQEGVAVVLVSRCLSGELLEDTYSFVGSETHLKKIGVIFASGMSGIKARIKLVLALSAGMKLPEIRALFEEGRLSNAPKGSC